MPSQLLNDSALKLSTLFNTIKFSFPIGSFLSVHEHTVLFSILKNHFK